MWVLFKDAFLSIVAVKGRADVLKVRARFKGDIERIFPAAQVIVDAGTDYKFRALVDREAVAAALAEHVRGITATNFKSSVAEGWRHDVYLDVWNVLYRAQKARAHR
jgi:hypothetical protein